jgi:hypothetical protein
VDGNIFNSKGVYVGVVRGLCRTHHRDNHRFGDEAACWGRQAIDPSGLRGSSGFRRGASNDDALARHQGIWLQGQTYSAQRF